jgi:phage head maturation protease
MSFGFRTLADHWTDQRTRELRAVQLVEVSVVHAFPAYPSTVVQARSNAVGRRDIISPATRRRLIEAL